MTDSSATIRACTDADIDGVVALIADRIGTEDAAEARIVLEDPSFDRQRWTVAVAGTEVVSTMANFRADLTVGTTAMAATMIEFVATARAFENRGLIRGQFAYHHDLAAARGEIVQFIVGIPYFYRRFGYELAIPMPAYRFVASADVPPAPDGWDVRDASAKDLDAIMALQRACAEAADVRLSATAEMRSWYLESPAHRVRVAEHAGRIGAAWRVTDEDGPLVHDLAATGPEGVAAALHDAAGGDFAVVPRVATSRWLEPYGVTAPVAYAYYVRIGDPATFVRALASELERRLSASGMGDEAGELLISLYTSSLTISYASGRITAVTPGPRMQAPVSAGGSGVPPDAFAALALGPLTVDELDARLPDFLPGKPRDLLSALFPGLSSDIDSWVPP